VFSVTSWSELARDGLACEQRALRRRRSRHAFIAQQLGKGKAPIVAATDYVRAVPESVRAFLPEGRRYLTLGTDGFGRSDTRAALRASSGWMRRASRGPRYPAAPWETEFCQSTLSIVCTARWTQR
jgi:pyruvate dehydrogenase E1 component